MFFFTKLIYFFTLISLRYISYKFATCVVAMLKFIGEDLDLIQTPLSYNYTEEEIREMIKFGPNSQINLKY